MRKDEIHVKEMKGEGEVKYRYQKRAMKQKPHRLKEGKKSQKTTSRWSLNNAGLEESWRKGLRKALILLTFLKIMRQVTCSG